MVLYLIKHQGRKYKGNGRKFKKLLIVRQIPPGSTMENVQRTVWRTFIFMLECQGLNI